jgi:copper chaperone NosL
MIERRAKALLLVWLLSVLGCEDYTRASEPVWDKQPCAHCHMLVSDPRFAAQLVTHAHERLYFDDPGCLAAYAQAHTDEIELAWVHTDAGWTQSSHARFKTGASSPMGYGFIADAAGEHDFAAVRSAASAQRRATSGGSP